jgi:hypothetical protein
MQAADSLQYIHMLHLLNALGATVTDVSHNNDSTSSNQYSRLPPADDCSIPPDWQKHEMLINLRQHHHTAQPKLPQPVKGCRSHKYKQQCNKPT